MRSEEENFFNPRSNSEIEAEMKGRGFVLLGNESLTRFKFSSEAKFETIPVKTEEDVKKEYEEYYKGAVEIKLVEQEGLSQQQRAVLVFGKKKE